MSPEAIRLLMVEFGDLTLSQVLEKLGAGKQDEAPCGLCRVLTDIEFLEESSDWPVCLLCPACRAEVQQDEEHPSDGEQLEANRSVR